MYNCLKFYNIRRNLLKEILLTGAAGYIGSHTAYWFLKHTDYNLIIIDNLSSGFRENITFLESVFKGRISFIKACIDDENVLDEVFSKHKIECVVHFAASLIVPESTIKPLLYYSNNTKNTLFLISKCISFGINKFIFSSTAAVYGNSSAKFVSENDALSPINPYGSSKMMSEMIMNDASKAYDFNFVALRYFNVAGALSENDYKTKVGLGQRSQNATHLIKVACECASGKRESMSIFGDDYPTADGTCVRDYIHIDDLALAHLGAFEYLREKNRSEVFNVGYGRGYSVKEVVEKVKEISKVDFKVLKASRRDGDPASLVADNTKILRQTSWRPKFDNLDIIIQSAYNWEIGVK